MTLYVSVLAYVNSSMPKMERRMEQRREREEDERPNPVATLDLRQIRRFPGEGVWAMVGRNCVEIHPTQEAMATTVRRRATEEGGDEGAAAQGRRDVPLEG